MRILFLWYRALFIHGFAVDENGHKMSKSLGNIISPQDISVKYGVDSLRYVKHFEIRHLTIFFISKYQFSKRMSIC